MAELELGHKRGCGAGARSREELGARAGLAVRL